MSQAKTVFCFLFFKLNKILLNRPRDCENWKRWSLIFRQYAVPRLLIANPLVINWKMNKPGMVQIGSTGEAQNLHGSSLFFEKFWLFRQKTVSSWFFLSETFCLTQIWKFYGEIFLFYTYCLARSLVHTFLVYNFAKKIVYLSGVITKKYRNVHNFFWRPWPAIPVLELLGMLKSLILVPLPLWTLRRVRV